MLRRRNFRRRSVCIRLPPSRASVFDPPRFVNREDAERNQTTAAQRRGEDILIQRSPPPPSGGRQGGNPMFPYLLRASAPLWFGFLRPSQPEIGCHGPARMYNTPLKYGISPDPRHP